MIEAHRDRRHAVPALPIYGARLRTPSMPCYFVAYRRFFKCRQTSDAETGFWVAARPLPADLMPRHGNTPACRRIL